MWVIYVIVSRKATHGENGSHIDETKIEMIVTTMLDNTQVY